MADDLTNRGAQDRARISLNEDHEVRYWTKELGVSKERLASVTARAGKAAETRRPQNSQREQKAFHNLFHLVAQTLLLK